MQRAIDMGRGGIWLELTEAQDRKLKGDLFTAGVQSATSSHPK